jgi:DNA-binding transcriptional LysR family regulator
MARINIEQLRTFLTTVRLGSVRKAALGLNITQPAVTARIKNLEQSLAAPLFDRTASGLRLTKRGERLVSYAEQFEHLTQLVEANITDPQGLGAAPRISQGRDRDQRRYLDQSARRIAQPRD